MHVLNYISYTFLFILSRQQLKQSALFQYNCKIVKKEIGESEMKSPKNKKPPKNESKVTTNSDGSSSTVSVFELENRRKEKPVPVGHFKRYFN